jgi:predicted nucleic acid-binding protein
MRLLFDTNIILDIALNRVPHYKDSANSFKKIDNKSIFGFITATTITDIYYIAKKESGHIEAIDFITNLIQIVDVVGIDREIIINSLTSQLLDFEDAIQSVASSFNNIDFIITRNIKDFSNSEIKAISPTDFLLQYKIKR